MTFQRYRSDTDRTRRVAGVVFLVIGSLFLAVMVRIALDNISTGLVVTALLPTVLIAIGIRFFLHVVAAVDVDLEARRYSLIREGKPAGGGDLDELAPLRVSREVVRASRGRSRTQVVYAVRPAGVGYLSLFKMTSPGRARQKMEGLARKWRISCQSLNGPVREHEHLDVSLHVRLQDDAEAWAPATLKPAWRIGVAPIFRGQAIVSHHRSFDPLIDAAAFALIPLPLLLMVASTDFLSDTREMFHEPFGQTLLALAGALACVLGWQVVKGLRDTFRPGAIEVSDRGVAYRWSRMEFDRIEEVTAGDQIEIVGDHRVLSIPRSFCPRDAVEPVAHELQRLILEASAKRGL